MDCLNSNLKIPPIFDDLNERVRSYLLNPENLPIHQWERSQQHWHREVNLDSLLDDDEVLKPRSTLDVIRNPVTGEIEGIEEILLPDDNEGSLSMSRAPLPPRLSTRGTNTQMPFLPAGFEEELQSILDSAADQHKNISFELDDRPGKFLGEDLLTNPPGSQEGVIFAEDGVTILNKPHNEEAEKVEPRIDIEIQANMDLDEIIDASVHLAGLWKSEEEQPPPEPQKPQTTEEENELFETTPLKEEIELPVLNITSSNIKTGVTSTEWAEMIDVTLPVPDFREKIKEMAHTYAFELDNFQKQAILKLEEGHHVFVAAHTSAGKTVVAEYAIAMSRRNCTRAIYTSPIKALSNQKYNDFTKLFGEVGLLTGDLQINATAPCLVMTTEILRSMLYCGSDVTRDLEFVIFDEVHYINNAERGYVWEEVLILLPAHVTIVMLSATVPNTLQFADWLGRTKKRKVYVVSTPKRPVPLCHYLYTGSGGKSKNERFLVIDQEGNFQLRGYNEAVAAKKARENDYQKNFGPKKKHFMNTKAEQTMWVGLIDHLKANDKLPVVAFTLSRNRCDQNAENLMSVDLTTAKEKSHIHSFFQKCLHRLKVPDRKLPQVMRLQRVLSNGIGVHHSGILPLLKEIVEMLFQSGHVKILFATETFAMGVNMPARTVVFDEVTKFDGIERRALVPAEYIQMAGRAGRRGLDKTGTVIIICKDVVPDLVQLKAMMLGTPQKLSSQFRLTYAMILSLLRVATVSVEGMMQRSFREFDHIIKADSHKKQLEIAEKEYSLKCSTPLAPHLNNLGVFYDTAAEYIDVLNEIMPILLDQPKVAKEFVAGRVLFVSVGPYINQLAVYLNKTGPRLTPYKVLLLEISKREIDSNRFNFEIDDIWYRVLSFTKTYENYGTDQTSIDHTILCISPKDVISVTKVCLKIEPGIIIQDWEKRQMPRFKDADVGSTCLAAVQQLLTLSHSVRNGSMPEVINLTQSLAIKTGEILKSLDKMSILGKTLEEQRKYTDIANFKDEFANVYERKQAERKRDKYRRLLSYENLALYPDYQRRLMVLRELNYIDQHDSVILKGRVACGMGTNELIISELVFRNVFTDKTPAEIAALLSCFVFQARTQSEAPLTDKLTEGIKTIQIIDDELTAIESKYLVGQFEGQPDRLNFGLVRVVYEWALEKPFAEIMDLTDVQEGIIVRCIQQLHELLVDVKDAAVAIGDPMLQAKMLEASTAIKRDIVFAASLYTTQKDGGA